MGSEPAQEALDRYKDIGLAAIAYNIQKQEGLIPPGQEAFYKNFHQVWKDQIDKQYQENELEKLEKLVQNLTVVHKITGDIDFVEYIKETTGYDYDLFGNIYERIDKIISRNRIANRKEKKEVLTMIEIYRRTSAGEESEALLINLLDAFDLEQLAKKHSL